MKTETPKQCTRCNRTEAEGASFYEAQSIRRCKDCHRARQRMLKTAKTAPSASESIAYLRTLRHDRWPDRIARWYDEKAIDYDHFRELIKWAIENRDSQNLKV